MKRSSQILAVLAMLLGGAARADYFITDLDTFGGTQSSATGINNLGQVVGTASFPGDALSHAFLYSNGTMTDLNNQLPANSGWIVISQANSINDNGQVAGTGITSSGFTHAFLLNVNS